MPYTIGSVQVIQTPLDPPEKDKNYDNAEPSVTVLRRNYKKDPDAAPFQVDTIFEKDVVFTLRDGIKIRADILRPADESVAVPALVAWSPYGKGGRGAIIPFSMLEVIISKAFYLCRFLQFVFDSGESRHPKGAALKHGKVRSS
jgi:hypothetical protein